MKLPSSKLSKLLLLLFAILLFPGCSHTGKLDEGACKGVISMAEIPNVFYVLDNDFLEQIQICVLLENPTTKTEYQIALNNANKFRQEIMLNPGIYKVKSLRAENAGNLEMKLISSESMTFSEDQYALLDVQVKNADELNNHWAVMQPLSGILHADPYSGMVQINRKVIPIQDIMPELDFSNEKNLKAHEREEFTDAKKGIVVTLENKTDSPLFFEDCEVIEISVTKDSVVFPSGVAIGSPTDSVCHQKKGVYGEPTYFQGSALFSRKPSKTFAVYVDSASGNRITIGFDGSGDHVSSIRYELGVAKQGDEHE